MPTFMFQALNCRRGLHRLERTDLHVNGVEPPPSATGMLNASRL
jgi:hypothetical protein